MWCVTVFRWVARRPRNGCLKYNATPRPAAAPPSPIWCKAVLLYGPKVRGAGIECAGAPARGGGAPGVIIK